MTTKELLVATTNAGKLKELERLFANLPIRLRSLNDFPTVFEPEETGLSFTENAILKAKSYALQTGLWALGDDSGLEVEALNGAPGIFSARYGGARLNDAQRTEKLLDELNKTQDSSRSAKFVCAMAVSDEKGDIIYLTEGVCKGKIAVESSGRNGFGYDPIFVPEGFSETFGELSNEIKERISHRALASDKIITFLRGFIAT
jgi:XTP/dITP diphosphohydrolase